MAKYSQAEYNICKEFFSFATDIFQVLNSSVYFLLYVTPPRVRVHYYNDFDFAFHHVT